MSKLAFIFPGQGSQSVGMLGGREEHQEIIDKTLEEASEALGYSMAELINDGPEDRLNQTEYTQPAILAASIAIHRIEQHKGCSYDYVAGHSLGEYSALAATGALGFAEALKLVRLRGQLMQEAVKPGDGKMLAVIGSDVAKLEAICEEISDDSSRVTVANFNSPKQVVVSGHASAVDRLLERSDDFAAKRTVELPVTVPSHCSLMKPAADKFSSHLDKAAISAPSSPLLPNVDPAPTTDPATIRDCLKRQLYSPVQWVQTIKRLANDLDVSEFKECGPGRVLASLQRQIL